MLTIKSFNLKGEKMKRKIYERLKGVLKIELIKKQQPFIHKICQTMQHKRLHLKSNFD